jgi:hypothetical protein
VLRQQSSAIRIDLAERYGLHSGPFQAEAEAADTTEQIENS